MANTSAAIQVDHNKITVENVDPFVIIFIGLTLFQLFYISDEMWAGVLFFLFSVGSVFYVFEHLNIWIQRNETEQPILKNPPAISTTSVHVAMDDNMFMSSKFIFKKVIDTNRQYFKIQNL